MKRFLLGFALFLLLVGVGGAQEFTTIRLGPIASRPACTYQGQLWFVTDTGAPRWTYCNGSAWSDVAPGLNSGVLPVTFIPTLPLTGGGTGQTTADAAFNALAPSKTGNSLKVLRVNTGETGYELVTLAGGGDALVANPLSQFAQTTSLQLKDTISNETGSGALVFGTAPNITSPTGIVKGDVGLGSVDNTTDAGKPVSTAQQTALDLKANLAGPTFTGTPAAPTAAFATNTTQLATTAYVIGSAPVYVRVTGSNATTTGQALVNITGLSVALTTNAVYEFEANLSVSTTAVTTGTSYGVNYSVAGGAVEAQITGALTTTAVKNLRINALNTAAGPYLTTSAQTGGVLIKGIITTGANAGNFTVSHLKVTSGTSTVFINSFLKVTRIS